MKKRRKLKIILIAIAIAIVAIVCYFAISGWIDAQPTLDYKNGADTGAAASPAPTYPDAEFAVISDLHMYDPSLGDSGSAFEAVMNSDRKLLLDSEALLDYAIDEIISSNAEFVLISGDMTKDGALVNHEIVAEKLARLKAAGLGVYVVPGNHDVNNPDAASFSGDKATKVESVTAEEFEALYYQSGYGEALERDPGSLSYVAGLKDGLWLLALDNCRYRENKEGEHEIVGGKMSQETADWIAGVLEDAAAQGIAVIAMSHHGIVEHWDGQRKLHPDYLIEDYVHVGEMLASYNVRLVFTGHYHALDITRGDFDNKYIYDIETGALVTAPCAIRYCSLKDGALTIETDTIVDKLKPGTDFADDATAFVKKTVKLEAISTLKEYKVPDKDAEYIAEAIGDAFVAHYAGDENLAEKPEFDPGKLGLWARIVFTIQKYVLDGTWIDLDPADNDITIRLD
jgi:predicted MPP superfamily phosphohydrolase